MAVTAPALDRLRTSFGGELVLPADAGYDDARRVWCALIDTDPAAIYGAAKTERLRALKRTWDPDNVFRLNKNIAP